MADISEGRIKNIIGKSWSSWNLPECSTDNDLVKLREVYKPKEPDKPADHCNLLPASLMHLYGSRPDIEFFSVTKCAGCKYFIKTQWLSHHFKRDTHNNMVCRKTELIVSGSKVLGKATTALHEIRESTRTPFIEISTAQSTSASSSPSKSCSSVLSDIAPAEKSTTRIKTSSIHKTETLTTTSSSKSKSDSHHKSKSKSSSSSTTASKISKSSSKTSSSGTSNSWSTSKSGSSKASHKSSPSPGTYTLSIPSDDTGQNESVESILFSNSGTSSKHTMHIIATSTATAKSKSGDTEYEQLKFYADSGEKKSKSSVIAAESNDLGYKGDTPFSHPNSDGSYFKIPFKSKSSSSSSASQATVEHNKKLKSSHTQSKSSQDLPSNKIAFRSASASSESPKPTSVCGLTSSVEIKIKGDSSHSHSASDSKEKSSSGHSKKKKKKKDKDEPRKVIPLKDRAFHADLHCGVCLPEDSNPCTRSLTCKTHSVALRRAVAGRSHPFDSLLAAHKKARDEEKNAKAREHGDEVKSKSKKSSHTITSAVPDPVFTVQSHGAGTAKGTSVPAKVTGTLLAPTPAPVVTPVTSMSTRSVSSLSNNGPKTIVSSNKNNAGLVQLSSNNKSQNKPVIIVEEEKQVPGLSLFDIARETENKFTYVSSLKTSKEIADVKLLEGHRITALSEWNPLERFGFGRKDKSQERRRKTMKDMLTPVGTHKILDPDFFTAAVRKISTVKTDILCSLGEPTHPHSQPKTAKTGVGSLTTFQRNLKRKHICNKEIEVLPNKNSRQTSPKKGMLDGLLNINIKGTQNAQMNIMIRNSREATATTNSAMGSQLKRPPDSDWNNGLSRRLVDELMERLKQKYGSKTS